MASRKERDTSGLLGDPSLTYGEILFRPFYTVMNKLYEYGLSKDERAHKFVDLGSGSGRPVFAAMLCHPFDNVVGIEILEGLSELANGLKTHWEEEVKANAPEHCQTTEVEFVHGDFMSPEIPWADADVVFINSTCYPDDLVVKIEEQLDKLQKGAFAITCTKSLKSSYWQVVERSDFEEAWGKATLFVHRKIRETEAAD